MTRASDSASRLLIIGASALQVPAIERARELGYQVAVADRDPEAPGVALASAFYEVSTIDEDGVTAAARDFAPHGIITIGTDMPMRALAAAAEALGLRGPSRRAVYNATDKGAMAEALRAARVALPWTEVVTSVAEMRAVTAGRPHPLIMKPADSSGSRGVTLVESEEGMDSAFEYALSSSRSGRVIVQEYMRGPEVSVEGLCFGDERTIVAITDKITTGAPSFVELGHSQPSQLSGERRRQIEEIVQEALAALELGDCAFHAEIIVTADGPKLVEIGARLGGDFITSHLVPLSTGVDMIGGLIDIAVGTRPDTAQRIRRGSAVRFLKSPGTPSRAPEARAMAGVVLVAVVEGTNARAVRSSTDRLGHVIAEGDTVTTASTTAEAAITLLLKREP
ncbi:ATP-grasp domain-containing protein [Microbacterium sp. Mcb102]|uniref:ATP-grasp domain-containing protein n=1 Tax=Microbacterium sp. Mcb102 TaxID=2926012 RepID=UPI0021C76954|nr:ATP-grasp domain-containing protein [Microbacterium sp. Mcb102]